MTATAQPPGKNQGGFAVAIDLRAVRRRDVHAERLLSLQTGQKEKQRAFPVVIDEDVLCRRRHSHTCLWRPSLTAPFYFELRARQTRGRFSPQEL